MSAHCKIHKTAVLQSNDYVVSLYGEDGLYTCQKTVVYKNVSSHSMKRFYKVSDCMQSVRDTKEVHWQVFYNIFKRS